MISSYVESRSERDGLEQLKTVDSQVLSVGISTGGGAEIRMAELEPSRYIIATTLDVEGAESVRHIVDTMGLHGRIEICVEDIASESLLHNPGSFDFVYARLVLHYLSKQRLAIALNNLHALLKPCGRLFVVVRSADCEEAQYPDNTYNELTGLTTYKPVNSGRTADRYFHTQKSISKALMKAHFVLKQVNQFDEQLSPGFNRDSGVWISNNVIEVLAEKTEMESE